MILTYILIGILVMFFINIYNTSKGTTNPFTHNFETFLVLLMWPVILVIIIINFFKAYIKYNKLKKENDESYK